MLYIALFLIFLIYDSVTCVNTSFGSSSMLTKVCKVVDVVIDGIHMLINMLVLPIFDFDVVLGMNWLNEFRATINFPYLELSLDVGEK